MGLPESHRHVPAADALLARLREHLHSTRCSVHASDMTLGVAGDAVCYLNVMVGCDDRNHERDSTASSPRLIADVSFAPFNWGDTFAAYRKLPSLQEYLLVNVKVRRLELFRRESVGWVLHEADGEGDAAVLRLASLGLDLTGLDVFGDLRE